MSQREKKTAFIGVYLRPILLPSLPRCSPPPPPGSPAPLATALFAAFPFSRQAVAWPGALYNPLVSAMAAGTLLAYDRGRRGYGMHWIGLALLLAALAPFNYEAGLLVGPLVVLAEGAGRLQRRWQHRSWWPLAFVGLFLVTLAIWRGMRGTGVTGFGLTLPDLRRNAGYLVQGLVYPVAPLAQRLAVWWDLDPELSLWLIALPTLALLVWSGLRWNPGVFWLGVGWFALFALPPLVSMKADWFALAPRYLYLPAVGISLVWATAASGWLARLRPHRRAVASGILLVALLTPAAVFVRQGVRLYAMVGESLWAAAEAATRERPLLLVNLPMRITPRGRTYPLGFEGIIPLPARVTAEGLVYVHTHLHDAAEAVAFGAVAVDEPPGYTYRLFGPLVGWEELATAARQARAVYLTRYGPEHIRLLEAGGLSSSTGEKALARFGDRVALLDATRTPSGYGSPARSCATCATSTLCHPANTPSNWEYGNRRPESAGRLSAALILPYPTMSGPCLSTAPLCPATEVVGHRWEADERPQTLIF